MEKIEYINNDEASGIKYNFKKILARCKKLKLFPEDSTIWNPLNVPFHEWVKWFILMSIRAKGKTTNVLLLGLVMNEMYGTTTVYIGQNADKLRPKYTSGLYNIVLENNYISRIYNDRWNSIVLKPGGKWFLCNKDENGKVIELSGEPVCIMLNVADHMDYKSTVNIPRGDLIVFDEFISKFYYPNEFIDLCDLLSTVIRVRISPIIFLLANTVNKHYQYFNELDIYEQVQSLQAGQNFISEGLNGSKVYCEIIDPSVSEKRKKFNKLFFGFSNPSLGAITGDTTWTEYNYPHIIKDNETKVILPNCYIYHNKKYVNLEIVTNKMGLCINAHWATRTYDDSIIYTLQPIYDIRYRYKLGLPQRYKIDKLIYTLFQKNKVYYQTNDIGSFVESYIKACKLT